MPCFKLLHLLGRRPSPERHFSHSVDTRWQGTTESHGTSFLCKPALSSEVTQILKRPTNLRSQTL